MVLSEPFGRLEGRTTDGTVPLGTDQLLVDVTGQSRISVQHCAVAMIDELERPTRVRQRFTVGY